MWSEYRKVLEIETRMVERRQKFKNHWIKEEWYAMDKNRDLVIDYEEILQHPEVAGNVAMAKEILEYFRLKFAKKDLVAVPHEPFFEWTMTVDEPNREKMDLIWNNGLCTEECGEGSISLLDVDYTRAMDDLSIDSEELLEAYFNKIDSAKGNVKDGQIDEEEVCRFLYGDWDFLCAEPQAEPEEDDFDSWWRFYYTENE